VLGCSLRCLFIYLFVFVFLPPGPFPGGFQPLTPRAEEEEAAAEDRRTQQRAPERDGSEVWPGPLFHTHPHLRTRIQSIQGKRSQRVCAYPRQSIPSTPSACLFCVFQRCPKQDEGRVREESTDGRSQQPAAQDIRDHM